MIGKFFYLLSSSRWSLLRLGESMLLTLIPRLPSGLDVFMLSNIYLCTKLCFRLYSNKQNSLCLQRTFIQMQGDRKQRYDKQRRVTVGSVVCLSHSVHALSLQKHWMSPSSWVFPWAINLSPPLHTMVMTCFLFSISDETPIIAVMVALSSLLVIVFIIIVLYMLRWACELILLRSHGLYFSNPRAQAYTAQKTGG